MARVTQDNWNVSYQTGYVDGQIIQSPRCRLSVFKGFSPAGKARRGDCDGRLFPNMDAASDFALDHGYIQTYYSVDYAVLRHTHRDLLRRLHGKMMQLMRCREVSRQEFIQAINVAKTKIIQDAGNPLAGTHWSCGYFAMAHRLRPDLVE